MIEVEAAAGSDPGRNRISDTPLSDALAELEQVSELLDLLDYSEVRGYQEPYRGFDS